MEIGLPQGFVLGYGPQDIVAGPLHLDHAAHEDGGDPLIEIPRQVDLPEGEVHAVLKDPLQALQGQGQVNARLLPRVGRDLYFFSAEKAHDGTSCMNL